MTRPNLRAARRIRTTVRGVAAAVAAVAAAGFPTAGHAMDFDVGNPDIQLRWDNTIRFNYAMRANNRNSKIGNSAIADEGTYSFDQGDAVATRLDLLSELDFIYKKRYGFRVSAARLVRRGLRRHEPHAIRTCRSATSRATSTSSTATTTKRYYHGPSGELLDAFVFGTFDAGDVPVSMKAGRHSLYWGESLFLGGNLNSVAYAQNPLDLQKGFATPGVEAKELFRPLTQFSGAGAGHRHALVRGAVPAGVGVIPLSRGRHLPRPGRLRVQRPGPPVHLRARSALRHAAASPRSRTDAGEWGLAPRWSPEWLDGTLGFYYRNFADKLPQTFITRVGAGQRRATT